MQTCLALRDQGLLFGQLLLELSILLHQTAHLLPPRSRGRHNGGLPPLHLTALAPSGQEVAYVQSLELHLCAQLLFVLLQSHVDLRSLAPLLRQDPTA